jgi:PAS domain S-box-containing protein
MPNPSSDEAKLSAVEQSEQEYLRLLSALTSYRYTVRLENGVPVSTRHTAGCLGATGYGPDDYARDPGLWLSMIHPEDRPRVLEQLAYVVSGQEVPAIEHRITHRNGMIRWIRDTIVLHRDEQGRVDHYDGLVEDITERKDAEELFRQFLESAPDAIVIVDGQGTIALVNAQAERVFGCAREEVVGGPLETLVPEKSREQHREHRVGYTADPCIRTMGAGRDVYGRRKDGSQFPAAVMLSPLKTGTKTLVVSSIRDISAQRKMEELQLASEARLLAAQKIQERLLPDARPRMHGIDVSGAVWPAEFVAGDYFDYFDTDDGSLVVAIGDVSGHGVGPGLLMASTHAIVRTLLLLNKELNETLEAVNRALLQEQTDHFVTLLLARVKPGRQCLEYVNAGHPPGYVLDVDGHVKSTLDRCTFPVGLVADFASPKPAAIQLGVGDTVLLLTDGVLETAAPWGEYFGKHRVLEVARRLVPKSAHEIVAGLCSAVLDFTGGQPLRDDITVLVLKTTAGRPSG